MVASDKKAIVLASRKTIYAKPNPKGVPTLEWETYDVDRFRVFLRDLSASTDINLRHMIEQESVPSYNPKISPPKTPKKKDLIIQENQKRLLQRDQVKDRRTVAYLLETIDDTHPYRGYATLVTDEGQRAFKGHLLQRYWRKRKTCFHHALVLYFHLQTQVASLAPDVQETLETITEKTQEYQVKGYMLEKLGHMLSPLNDWETGHYVLDPWQRETLDYIRKKESVLVKAPTSSGKTFVAMATGILHTKILYVCPAKPVAYQVGANFLKMGYRVHFLVENHMEGGYDDRTNIFVGTPDIIEESLPKLGTQFEYAVFDEIHMLNEYETGLCYENIVKLLTCPYLALSATIANIEFLRDLFARYHPKPPRYIEYTKRFLNQQRWVYTETGLKKIHPLRCLDVAQTDSLRDLTFSPNDCYTMYESLSDVCQDTPLEDRCEDLCPDTYFARPGPLTLYDATEYEGVLKAFVEELPNDQKVELRNRHQKSYRTVDTLETLRPFFQTCKRKEMLPMLYFHTEELVAKEIFRHVYEILQSAETSEYPAHYRILEKKDTIYREYLVKREVFASHIKIKTKDALSEKEARLSEFDASERARFIQMVSEFYDQSMTQCRKNDEPTLGTQLQNLEREKQAFLTNPDFRAQDVFQKHRDFCFTEGDPMSGEEIRDIRKRLKASTGQTLEYEDPLLQLLKRGIGLYVSSMPDEYNWTVQRLLSQKKLGIVVSDRTLCLGIDLPIRSVTFSGYRNPTYSPSDYLQMSGRAGRRGKDKQGNILFHGLSETTYLGLMQGHLPLIEGSSKPMYEGYLALPLLNPGMSLTRLSQDRIHSETPPLVAQTLSLPDVRFRKILWTLRHRERGLTFVNQLPALERRLFRESEDQRETALLQYLSDHLLDLSPDVFQSYKTFTIEHDTMDILRALRILGSVCRTLTNTLHPLTFRITCGLSTLIFERVRSLGFKYRLL